MEDKKLEMILMAIVGRLDTIIEQNSALIEGIEDVSELLGEEIEEETPENTEEPKEENPDERKIKTKFTRKE